MLYFTRYASPIGELTLCSDGQSLTGLTMEGQAIPGEAQPQELPLFQSVRTWLDSYFQGEPLPIDFPLAPAGTAFQKRIWEMLLTIPYGETTTYGAIAEQLSATMSPQAVGSAVGRNPISIVIPCHRVVGARGELIGYAGGLKRKEWLLSHEQGQIMAEIG